jgi:hypothetical protein
VAQLVEELRYKPEGRGFDFRWGPSGRTMALGSTQSVAEMSARAAGALPPSCAACLEILGASTCCCPKGLARIA